MAPRLWFSGSHEEFPPSVLLEQAVAAARAGFEGIGCSDHFAPWFPDGQSGNAWVWLGAAGSEQEAIAGARRWKATQLPELYREDIHDPQEMQRLADERLSDEQFAHEGFIVSDSVEEHVSRLRQLADLEASVICMQLIGQADPMGTIRVYGERVLPALRERRAETVR